MYIITYMGIYMYTQTFLVLYIHLYICAHTYLFHNICTNYDVGDGVRTCSRGTVRTCREY